MESAGYGEDDAIVALATGWAESALAVVRATGKGCVELAAALVGDPAALRDAEGGTVRFARIVAPGTGELIDEATVAVHRSPRSFTGEDSVEITCHGSLPGLSRILQAMEAAGFRKALPGEFSFRAFMNGKIDLSEAEAVQELVGARTEEARGLALRRLAGGLRGEIAAIKAELLGMLAAVELRLDYAEDDDVGDEELPLAEIEGLEDRLARLSDSWAAGKLYSEGVRIALAGRTNSGKSSLFNLFLKEERAIVSEHHGTTRDYLGEWIDLGGVPSLLFDTAGLREPGDPVEAEGIARSAAVVDQADLVLYLVDAERGFCAEDRDFIRAHGYLQLLVVWSKCDLAPPPEGEDCAPVSAATGEGFAGLVRLASERVLRGLRPGRSELALGSERQKLLVDRALEALESVRLSALDGMSLDIIAPELREAVDALGGITGETATEDILRQIFSRFCVGK